MKVVLARHGETEWSRAGRHTSRTDVPLDDNGRREAAAIGRRLTSSQEWPVVLCSPMRRALDTCQLAGFAGRAVVDDDLCEWDYGEYEGLTTPDILERDPRWSLWRDGCPGGESPEQTGRRADRVLARLRDGEADAIVFAHGHILRVIGARWVGQPPSFGAHLMLSTGSLSTLGWEHGAPALAGWNDTRE